MVLSPSSDSHSSWAPLKALASLVECAVLARRPGLRHDLEAALKRHKPQMIALLKNPVRRQKFGFLKANCPSVSSA